MLLCEHKLNALHEDGLLIEFSQLGLLPGSLFCERHIEAEVVIVDSVGLAVHRTISHYRLVIGGYTDWRAHFPSLRALDWPLLLDGREPVRSIFTHARSIDTLLIDLLEIGGHALLLLLIDLGELGLLPSTSVFLHLKGQAHATGAFSSMFPRR